MKITIIGATGFTGSALARELKKRGHTVVGTTRTAADTKASDVDSLVEADVHDPATIAEAADGSDAIVVAVQPLSDRGTLSDATPKLVEVASAAGARLGVVGGAGSLFLPGTQDRLIDQPDFPDAWKPGAVEHVVTLDVLRALDTSADWFVVSPSRLFGRAVPGEPRGAYRVGKDELLFDEEGQSHIGIDDFVSAIVDELENPRHHGERFTVGY